MNDTTAHAPEPASSPSIEALRRRCSDLFNDPVLIADGDATNWHCADLIDVVLLGDGIAALLDAGNWPRGPRFRIWALGSAYAQALNSVFFGSNAVGSISRYALYPPREMARAFPDPDDRFDLVYSGRAARAKQLGLTLEVARHFQHAQKNPTAMDFQICTPSGTAGQRYRAIASHGWRKAALWRGDLGEEGWLKVGFRNPVLIALSIFSKEDFGVSVAQAQQHGWPLILSDWGGHRDVVGSNVIRVDPFDICNGDVAKIVKQVRREMRRPRGGCAQSRPFKEPVPLSNEQILNSAEKFLERARKHAFQCRADWFSAMSGTGLPARSIAEDGSRDSFPVLRLRLE